MFNRTSSYAAALAIILIGCSEAIGPEAAPDREVRLGGGPPGACQPWPSCKDDGDGDDGSGSDGSLTVTFRDAAGDEVNSDGLGDYADGVCGVEANFSLEDAILRTGSLKGRDKKTCSSARAIKIAFASDDIRDASLMSVEDIELMAVGTTILTDVGFAVQGCAGNLHLDSSLGTSDVEVTRDSETQWTVQTRADPDNMAVCLDSNLDPKFTLNLDFGTTIVN